MLRYEQAVPRDVKEGAPLVVLLHGRGSDRHDLLGLAPHLAPDAVVVTPEAPLRIVPPDEFRAPAEGNGNRGAGPRATRQRSFGRAQASVVVTVTRGAPSG